MVGKELGRTRPGVWEVPHVVGKDQVRRLCFFLPTSCFSFDSSLGAGFSPHTPFMESRLVPPLPLGAGNKFR